MNPDGQADLLVIGGGVLGAFHAYHAIERGLRVILVDRHDQPRGATVRNFGQVVPSGLDSKWQHFGRASLEIYQELQRQHDISVRQLGTVYVASDEEEVQLIEELAAINAANDYPSEVWTAEQCCQRYPELKKSYCRAGLFFPDELSVNPRQMIHRLHSMLRQHSNFESHFRCPVVELAVGDDDQAVARTSDGKVLRAQKAVVCCGAEFQLLFPELFGESDLEAVKIQMMRLAPLTSVKIPGNVLTGLSIRRYESFSQCPSWNSVKRREDADSFEKRWGIHLLFKQEVDGGLIVGDSHEYSHASRVGELGFDLRADVNDFMILQSQKIFDLPSWKVESSWFGVYCQTGREEGIFTANFDGRIHVVTGIGGKGMTSSAGYSKHSIEEIWND